MEQSFNNWWNELKEQYAHYFPGCTLSIKDRDCWREFYDEGFTPRDAIMEDSRD